MNHNQPIKSRFCLSTIRCSLPALMCAATLSAGAHAVIAITPLVLQGDSVPGVGLITSIDSVAVNNAGQWLVEGDTDNPDTNADQVVLKSGVLAYRQGQSLAAPVGASISSFDSVRLNGAGNTGWNMFLFGRPSNLDSGVFFNATLIIQESTISTAPQFSPSTPYIGWFEVRMNDSNQLMMVASVDDPNIPTTVDRALVLVNYNAGNGTFTESALYKEGDQLPGQAATDLVTDFGTSENNSAFNNAGQMCYCASLTGATATNGVIYRNNTLIAQKGGNSPIAGRTYTNISTSTILDMNSAGETVFKVNLSGDTATDLTLIKNNSSVFMQEGMNPPGVATETITSFGSGPVRIDDAGNVVWFGQWSGAAATNSGLFSGTTKLVQIGVTTINGMTLTTVAGSVAGFSGITKGFDVSPNGRYIIFRGLVNTTVRGAFLIDLGSLCVADIAPPGGNGAVNVDDLLLVINSWGPCPRPCPPHCAADVAPPGGNCVVNVDDLLAVINSWGACP